MNIKFYIRPDTWRSSLLTLLVIVFISVCALFPSSARADTVRCYMPSGYTEKWENVKVTLVRLNSYYYEIDEHIYVPVNNCIIEVSK